MVSNDRVKFGSHKYWGSGDVKFYFVNWPHLTICWKGFVIHKLSITSTITIFLKSHGMSLSHAGNFRSKEHFSNKLWVQRN